MNKLAREVQRRRTFAIISHPDAGKTTLTEKLLLYSGAIQLAGAVKARGDARRARSDWMKVERERGISVTASVMSFEIDGHAVNLLDTPGHEDFSEDTYRTLTAVDSAVMVLDAAKGIEAQTRKLFEVCRLRDMPILTFVNKLDREGKDPFELLDEIAETLALDVSPVTWPIGMGHSFRGTYDLDRDEVQLFQRGAKQRRQPAQVFRGLDSDALAEALPAGARDRLVEEVDLARGLCTALDLDSYREGHLTPVFFGSALQSVGVDDLLRGLLAWAPPPRPQPTVTRLVQPTEEGVAGFVFKIQANMDPRHRDRVAFVRLASGHFRRAMKLRHVRSGKTLTVHNPLLFLARDRELAEEAFPGDIVGVPNHGNLRIGDALVEGSEDLVFTGIPSFAPEYLRRVRPEDPMRAKHLGRALEQLAEEGAAQVFKLHHGGEWIVGVAGALQFDVLADRIRTEYEVPVHFEGTGYQTARWVEAETTIDLKRFLDANQPSLAEDHLGAPVFLARNTWQLKMAGEDWPRVRFQTTREHAE